VQARVAENFRRSGSFAGVGKPGEVLAIDYQMIVEIRSFEVRVNASTPRSVSWRNGEVRASKRFTASAPVSAAATRPIKALDSAFGDATKDVVRLTDTVI